jgi:hypothetical protein
MKAIRVAGLVTELDFERVRGEKLHDRTHLSCGKSKLRDVREERYRIEKADR